MTETPSDSARSLRRRFQLRLSTLLLLVAIAAVSAGWFADRRQLEQEIQSLRRETQVVQLKFVSSDHAASVVKELFAATSDLSLASDARLNCILVTGSSRDIDAVKAVLRKLDENIVASPATPR